MKLHHFLARRYHERKAITFDVYGTRADTEDAHRIAFNKAYAESPLNWNWDVALYEKLFRLTDGKERVKYFVERFVPMSEKMNRRRVNSHCGSRKCIGGVAAEVNSLER
jgi:hypothetical protein